MKKIKEFINPKDLRINYYNNKLNIVNYDELILLTEEEIIISKNNKTITVKGSDLSLLKLLENEILIGGFIKIIEL